VGFAGDPGLSSQLLSPVPLPPLPSANLLFTKTRNEWTRLSEQQRGELTDTFATTLQQVLAHPPGSVPVVLIDRISLLASSSAVLNGLSATLKLLDLAGHHVALAAPGSAVSRGALHLLQQVAEEADALDR
jgi:hypothetical protein